MNDQTTMLAELRVAMTEIATKLDAMRQRAEEDRAEIAAIRRELHPYSSQVSTQNQKIDQLDTRVTHLENGSREITRKIVTWVLAGVLAVTGAGFAHNAGFRIGGFTTETTSK